MAGDPIAPTDPSALSAANIPGLSPSPPDATPQQAEAQALQEYQSNPQLQAFIQANYGYVGWMLDIPELAGVLAAAAVNGWQQPEIDGALFATNWWKTNGSLAGQFINTQQTDPATAAQEVNAQKATIQDQAASIGVVLSDGQITNLATQAAMFQWNGDQINNAIRAMYQPTATPTGQAATVEGAVQQVAGNYLTDISPTQVQFLTADSVMNNLTPDQVAAQYQNLLQQQAEQRFPWMTSALEQGMTPKDYLSPYTQQAAKTLSIAPDSIDWSDPKWQSALLTQGLNGQQTPVSTDQFNKNLMQDPRFGYSKTQGAIDSAYTTAKTIEETFGAIKQ